MKLTPREPTPEMVEAGAQTLPHMMLCAAIWRAMHDAAPAVQAEPVAHCCLTEAGQIAFFDGKPMVMVGPVGNEHHSTPLYTHPVTSGWQPIETAPRERRILAVVDGLVRFVVWGKTSHVPMFGWCLVDQGAEDSELCEPTHWMPLPAPPSETGG